MDVKKLKKQAFEELKKIETSVDLEQFRIKYLGRKGQITAILRSLKDLPLGKRKKIGPEANRLRNELEKSFEQKLKKLQAKKLQPDKIDITAPGKKAPHGHLHPITLIMRKIEEIFQSMGFKIVEGFDIETEYYNFDALNIPKDHPARDVWNTFWLKVEADRRGSKRRLTQQEKLLLRTHTSPMQIRYMEKNNPPFRIVVPGRCFRYEATNASHSHTFYQLEGLMVDRHISVANFKAVIEEFLKKLFGENIKMRIRPSYFPFTEPSFEIDICRSKYPQNYAEDYAEGRGKSQRKSAFSLRESAWVEIMGAGMVHPNVFKAVGYVPSNWQGFAFGMGVDRIAMMKYKINDIRLLYSSDLRFLNQF